MERARQQAQSYARNLPPAEVADGGRPPFLIVADVGDSLALYSEFTRSGGNYVPFPDPLNYRIRLADLHDAEVAGAPAAGLARPAEPGPRAAQRTGHARHRGPAGAAGAGAGGAARPQTVAHFLMRCLFTMFAEDVGLLPGRSFTQLLADARHNVGHFPPLVEELWRTMAAGGFSLALRVPIRHFNGGLFEEATALPLDRRTSSNC